MIAYGPFYMWPLALDHFEKLQRQGLYPHLTKKELWSEGDKYMRNADVGVDEIINNKDNLKIVDRDGNTVSGKLPKSLEEFSQALEQTKKQIYNEYDSLTKRSRIERGFCECRPYNF